MKILLLILWGGIFLAGGAHAQSVRSLVNEGNDLYENQRYDEAELRYRKALSEDPGSVAGRFNLGNSLNKQKKYDESVREFDSAAMGTDEMKTRAGASFNKGNSFLEGGQSDQAIAAYIEALKLDPSDQDAKYNLSYALMKREQQQQKGGGQDQKNEQNNQQKQEKQNDQQNQSPNGRDNGDQKQSRQNEQQDPQPRTQQGEKERISKADAERILEVLKNDEKEVQKKLRAKAKSTAKVEKDW